MNVEPQHSIDPSHFRNVMGRFASGVTVIAANAGGEARGMTANAFMSGSLDPPLCVVSVAKRAHMHSHLTAAGRFSVNILAAGQENVAAHFAGSPRSWLQIDFRDAGGIPTVPGVSATITAEIAATHDCGDHTLFVGRILTMVADERPPLLYYVSRFAALLPLDEPAPLLPEFW
jgi:flavin reductase (DIM6/NTAB) family NADH-FMN oxidoreductase RutF